MSEQAATPTTEPAPKDWSRIASEVFGSDYKGETPPETAETSEAPVVVEPQEVQETSPQIEAVEETPSQHESALPSFTELDPEWIDNLEIPIKVNGEESAVKLSDLRKNHQINLAAEKRLEEAKATAKAVTQDLAKKQEQLTSHFAVVAQLVKEAETMLESDQSTVDWAKLRDQDPAEWTAKKTEFAERKARIDALKQNAVQSYQSSQQLTLAEQKEHMAAYLAEQQAMLTEKLPEWKDSAKAREEKKAIAEYLFSQGFNKAEIEQAADHRMVLMARKAMLYDKSTDKTKVAEKKIVNIPKVLKPGAPKPAEQVKSDQIAKLKQRLQKTGAIADAVALQKALRG
jgi:hypothetical protein